jgi:hypothetical protein
VFAGVRLGAPAAVLGVLAALATVAGCGGDSGGSSSGSGASAASLYAQELRPNPVVKPREGIDPDQQPESSNDAWVTLRPLGEDRFRLTVTNISSVGFINDFSWSPSPGMTVTHVIGSNIGRCRLSTEGRIACSASIRPPKCTCRPGGRMTVDFTARGLAESSKRHYGAVHSYVEIDGMTPVPYKIPSYLGAKPPEADLPLCRNGQESTSEHPCTHPR